MTKQPLALLVSAACLLALCSCSQRPATEETAATAIATTAAATAATTAALQPNTFAPVLTVPPALNIPPEAEPLRAALEAAMPFPMVAFEYGDFEGAGEKSAFAACAKQAIDGVESIYDGCQIWYAGRKGVLLVQKERQRAYVQSGGEDTYQLYGAPQPPLQVGKRKLFSWWVFAGGSGGLQLLFGVSGGKPYELQISGQYDWIEGGDDGEIVGTASDFSGGWHDWAKFFFRYDNATGELVPTQPRIPKPVKKIELTTEEQVIHVGETGMLNIRFTPGDAYNRAVEWTSSNPLVVEAGCYFHALSPGAAVITCRARDGSGVFASVSITVVE